MQKVRVPITVDPVKSAGNQLTYLGTVPGKSLVRLQEMRIEPCADVDVSLSFDTDEQGIKRISGNAQVTVQACCERCGESMGLTLASTFIYAPVTSRQADRKSTRLNSSHVRISYAVFCLKKKNKRR